MYAVDVVNPINDVMKEQGQQLNQPGNISCLLQFKLGSPLVPQEFDPFRIVAAGQVLTL